MASSPPHDPPKGGDRRVDRRGSEPIKSFIANRFASRRKNNFLNLVLDTVALSKAELEVQIPTAPAISAIISVQRVMEAKKTTLEGGPIKGKERSGSEPIKDYIAATFNNPVRKKNLLEMVVDLKDVEIKRSDVATEAEKVSLKHRGLQKGKLTKNNGFNSSDRNGNGTNGVDGTNGVSGADGTDGANKSNGANSDGSDGKSLDGKSIGNGSDLADIVERPNFEFISQLPLIIESVRGQKSVFTCRLSHLEAPLKWLHKGKECSSDQYTFSSEPDGTVSLTIQSTSTSDEGDYKAEIVDFASSSCFLRVIELPDKPRSLALTNVDEKFATLTWLQPAYDGNSALNGYVVERSSADHIWRQIKTRSADEALEFTDTTVNKGNSYRYRVRSVNKVGMSECDENDLDCLGVFIGPNPCAPFTDELLMLSGRLPDKTVKVGETVEFCLPIGGEPMPTVSWGLNGRPLGTTEVEVVRVEDRKTTLTISPAKKIHNGIVTLTLTNHVGELLLRGNITVINVPRKPSGPLLVDPLLSGKCQVSWQPPSDSEDDDIKEYIVEAAENTDQSGYFEVARSSGNTTSAVVKGLKMTSNYKFRIKASNDFGLSEALVGEQFHSVKPKKGLPGAPSQPIVDDWDSDTINISWFPPDSDGGFRVEKYIVESKETTARSWTKVGEFQGCEAAIKGLKGGGEYHFRVIAVNPVGPSHPSISSRAQKAVAKFGAPSIELKCKEPTVAAGRQLQIVAKVTGNPRPTLNWTHNNLILTDSPNHTCQYTGADRVVLNIVKTDRNHSGVHTVVAENESGQDAATITVKILDKPTAPEGPISITNVQDDSCLLIWGPPKDDGGAPINYYEVEKMEENSGVWAKAGKPTQSELLVDGLKKGQQYRFRVKAVNLEGSSEALQTSTSVVAKGQHELPGKPGAPVVESLDVDYVDLCWSPPTSDGGLTITGYLVELKTKRANEWLKAAEVKEPTPTTRIASLKEGVEYQFRVCAINAAGFGPVSDSSERFVTKKPTKPKIDRDALQSMTVKCDQDLMYPAVVRGYPHPEMVWLCGGVPVEQSEDVVILMESDFTELWFKAIQRRHEGRYRLIATNCAGSDAAEFNVTVVDKPSLPNGPVVVEPRKTGEVLLSWKEPDYDGGTAITYYEVEKRLEESDRWTHCCKTLDIQTRVGGLEVGRTFLFRVKAANRAGESEFITSNEPYVVKNTTLAPSKTGKPEIVDWTATSVDITWARAEDYDTVAVDKYVVEQKGITGRWEKVMEVAGTTTFATIEDLVYGDEYQFRVIPVNHVGKAEASAASAKVVVKPRFLAPSINRSDLADLTVRVNFRIKFSVQITGEPTPQIEWQLNEAMVMADERVKIDNQTTKSVLTVAKAKRSDSGRYKIIAKNRYGHDEAEVFVKVLSKPSLPEGPFQLSDVTEDHLTLTWSEPLDDGGVPVDYYEVEEFDSTKGNQWLMCGRTKYPRFLVESLVRSHHYKFRVRAVNQEGSSGHLEMKQTVQAKTPSHPSEAKQKPSGSSSQKAKEEPSSAPHFTFKLRNRLIMPGVNCKFTCHVAGKPLPNVSWMKDGQPVATSERLRLSNNQDGICSLELFLCAKDDAGCYTCVATNSLGSDETSAELSVEEKKGVDLMSASMLTSVIIQADDMANYNGIHNGSNGDSEH